MNRFFEYQHRISVGNKDKTNEDLIIRAFPLITNIPGSRTVF